MKPFPRKTLLAAVCSVVFCNAAFSGEILNNFQKEIASLVDSCKVSVVTVSARFSREANIEKESGLLSFFKSEATKTAVTSINVGTGIAFDQDGHILTRSSIVLGAESIAVTFVDGKEAAAKFIGNDPESGFAVLHVEGAGLDVAKLGDSGQIGAGSWILVIGNSVGAFPSVTMGALNAVRNDGLLQVTANLNLGNNGSPIFNLRGEIVGLIAGRLTPPYLMPDMLMGDNQYELFVAYPINWIEKVARDIIQFGKVRRGWIGAFGNYSNNGLTVTRIKDKSPAKEAGLLEDDVIVKFSNNSVKSVSQLARLVEYTPPGQFVSVEFMRDGQLRKADIEVGEKLHNKASSSPSPDSNAMMYFEWPAAYDVMEKNQALETRIEQLEKELAKLRQLVESQ